MTLRLKLNLVLSALLLTTLTAGLATFYVVGVYTEKAGRLTSLQERLRGIEEIRASILRWVHLVSTSNAGGAEWTIEGVQDSVEDRLAIMARTATTAQERAELAGALDAFRQFVASAGAAVTSGEGESGPAVFPVMDDIERRVDVLRQRYETQSYNALSESAMAGFRARVVAAVACIVIVLPAGWLIILTRRSLIEPIRRLVEAAGEIGRGHLDHKVRLASHDELGRLAAQVNEMAARLREHQEKLLRARDLATIGEICAGVAHGMRNPLAGIRTSAQVLSRRLVGQPEHQERLAELIDEVDRLEIRIARLLDFARPCPLERRKVSVGVLVDAAARDVNGVLRDTGARVVTADGARLVQVDVDPDQFAQALAEVFGNSAEHMPDGGLITVRATAGSRNGHGPATTISVVDPGSGMPPGGLQHAFDLFFTTRVGGTGVGLAAVRRIVEAHGGRISLASRLGEGTTVEITLPSDHGDGLPSIEARS